MSNGNILKSVEQYVFDTLKSGTPSEFVYHDINHTTEVVEACEKIGKKSGLSDDDIEILLIAAWFHDVGYLETSEQHEEQSAKAARKFLEENNLLDFALRCENDQELINRFLSANNFSPEFIQSLFDFLELVHEPLAIRSSSLLEDSQGQPFAGVYDTYMLPNTHPDKSIRLVQLLNMIKLVYASIYFQKSKDYVKVTSYRLEEEKMAVIVQKLVGAERNGRFYNSFRCK